jgi:exosome complex component RRP42
MPPTLLSPAELSYLHTSLSLSPPIRPDGRSARQFRPLVAETDILPNTNGSARICFSDGNEAIVGVKAEVEKGVKSTGPVKEGLTDVTLEDEDDQGDGEAQGKGRGKSGWVEVAVDVPGYREDDALPVFLSQMLGEALVVNATLRDRLWINQRFHWKLYIDVRDMNLAKMRPPVADICCPDTAPVSALIISSTSPLIDDASRTPIHSTSTSHLRRR